jgi:uncharacterized membrane protein YidH (DUF202 family)
VSRAGGSDADTDRADALAEQRTTLAWTRSGLALLGALAVLARRVWNDGGSSAGFLAVALLGAATLTWAVGIAAWHLRRRPHQAEPRRPGELLAIALATTAVGLCGLIVTVVT